MGGLRYRGLLICSNIFFAEWRRQYFSFSLRPFLRPTRFLLLDFRPLPQPNRKSPTPLTPQTTLMNTSGDSAKHKSARGMPIEINPVGTCAQVCLGWPQEILRVYVEAEKPGESAIHCSSRLKQRFLSPYFCTSTHTAAKFAPQPTPRPNKLAVAIESHTRQVWP